MNCKPGDLAVIVLAPSDPQHLGKIVTVKFQVERGYGASWVCDPHLLCDDGIEIAWNDRSLRPIRPDETTEESTEAMRRLHDTTIKQGEQA